MKYLKISFKEEDQGFRNESFEHLTLSRTLSNSDTTKEKGDVEYILEEEVHNP